MQTQLLAKKKPAHGAGQSEGDNMIVITQSLGI